MAKVILKSKMNTLVSYLQPRLFDHTKRLQVFYPGRVNKTPTTLKCKKSRNCTINLATNKTIQQMNRSTNNTSRENMPNNNIKLRKARIAVVYSNMQTINNYKTLIYPQSDYISNYEVQILTRYKNMIIPDNKVKSLCSNKTSSKRKCKPWANERLGSVTPTIRQSTKVNSTKVYQRSIPKTLSKIMLYSRNKFPYNRVRLF